VSRQRALLRFRLVPLAISALAERRIDGRPLLASLAIPDAALGEPIYLPLAKVQGFLDGCARLANEPLFAWNLASRAPLGIYGLVEFVMRTAGTLRDGIDAVCRYGGLVNGLISFEVDERDDEVAFGFSVVGERDAAGVQLNEYTLHYMHRMVMAFCGGTSPVTTIELAHRRRDPALVEAMVGGITVKFGAPTCRLWFPRGALDGKSPLSDPALHQFLETQIVASFAAEAGDDTVRAVRDTLAARLGRESLDVGHVARRLGLSNRTLQRRLRTAGTSYRDVVDLVRQERARELVLVDTLSIAEIAERVGYEDSAVFTRAFRRWTGVSPREHRKLK
jgi:AraC-like DNA-binding protein